MIRTGDIVWYQQEVFVVVYTYGNGQVEIKRKNDKYSKIMLVQEATLTRYP